MDGDAGETHVWAARRWDERSSSLHNGLRLRIRRATLRSIHETSDANGGHRGE